MINAFFESPIGVLEIRQSPLGIASIKRVEDALPGKQPVPAELRHVIHQLHAYFEGELTVFDLKLDLSQGSDFDRQVWRALMKIPYGQTTSYSEIAENIGRPKSIRAIGQANRRNPIAIVIPCHRCLAKDGKLQGYFYGLDVKQRLLALENPQQFAIQGQLL